MKFAFVQASTDPGQESISLVWTFYTGMERTGTITCRISEDAEESEPEWADALFKSVEACDFVLTSGRHTEKIINEVFQTYGMENRMRFISLRELEKLIRKMQLKQRVTYTSKTYLTGTKRYPERYLWLLSLLPADFISILKKSRESILPGHLAEFIRNEIPGVPGVYYFLDRNRRPLYIGKASDLKKRVISHFSASEEITKLFRLYLDVHTVEFEPTGSFLLAGLLEDHEIRHYWPSMNKAQKNPKNRYSIVAMSGRSGEIRLNITVSGRAEDGIAQFHSYPKAVSYLSELLERSQLDASASAIRLHKPQLAEGKKTANREKVILQLQKFRELSVYTLPGRKAGETGFVALDNGAFCGYGYLEDGVITADNEPTVLANLYRCRASITTEKLLQELTVEAIPAAVFKVKKGAIPSGTAPRYARALTFDFLQ